MPRALNRKVEYEIAYSLIPKFWNQGYGTEMAQQMKLFGSNHIVTERFISIIDKANTASINVAKKNGMHIIQATKYLGMDVFIFGLDT